jgi:hypothetical protein
MRTASVFILFVALASVAAAGQAAGMNESRLHRDFRVEKESLASCTNFAKLMDCGQTLVTGQPMHIAVGSLAPQNGVGFGLSFVEHKNFANEWRASWDVDAVATPNSSWRAGAYMKAFRLPGGTVYRTAPLINLYSQSISLNRVDYYGLGSDTTPTTHSTYGFSENITGVNAAIPFGGALHRAGIAAVAEVNGRFPSVRPGTDSHVPSTTVLFSEATAPGLSRQSTFIQASEGLRIDPALFKDHIRLNYLVQFQQFISPGLSTFSFRRFNGDFSHEIPLYNLLPGKLGKAYYPNRAALYPHTGPDDCTATNAERNISRQRAASADAKPDPARPCPIVATTDKLEGSITLRAYLSESFAGSGSVVPFYFMPTIGGSDIDGTRVLASYPDYRFRAPNLLLFRGTVEHSIGKLPLGAILSVDEAKVGLRRDDISIDHLRHTFSAGLTLRAGGLPLIYLQFAWGGNEGNHTTTAISPTLLGSSSRPSLF